MNFGKAIEALKDGKKVSTDHMTSFDIDWAYDRKTEVTVRSE